MRVSIIIPNYNYADYLPGLFLSLAQQVFPHSDSEIIFVDDGSTDDSVAVAHRWKKLLDYKSIKIIESKHYGRPGPVRNLGVEHASGEYLVFVDSDDTLAPRYIEECVTRLELCPEIDIAYTDCILMGGIKSRMMQLPEFKEKHMRVQNIVLATAAVRRSIFNKTKGYQANTGYEDWDLWLQMIQLGAKFSRIPKALMTYQQHADSYFQSQAKPKDALSKAKLVINNPRFFHNETLRWALGYMRKEPWAVPFNTGIIPQKQQVLAMIETFAKFNATKRPQAEKRIFSRWLEPPKFIPVQADEHNPFEVKLGERVAI